MYFNYRPQEDLEEEGSSDPEHIEDIPTKATSNSKETSGTSLSQEELEELKAKNPIKALKLMMSIMRFPFDKSQGSLTTSCGEPSGNSKHMLIQELQAKILYVDLFQAVKQDLIIVYYIKAMLQKLNTPNSGDSIVGFILEYDPPLETSWQ